ncbi:MAG: hypothetical protein CSA20_07360 [Deltaproteobacteria bacterium]|nr:MAG: hypothetical protein CSA20_07360 [Deltaproteobacteria bacterium]
MARSVGTVEIETFLDSWTGDEPARRQFEHFFRHLAAMQDVELQFMARPGVSYSMRPRHPRQKDRELFAIVDVIDDDPEQRWLSVCFYRDMISDPEERGELIPGGLAGGDGYCFDIFADDQAVIAYLSSRLDEAARAAADTDEKTRD